MTILSGSAHAHSLVFFISRVDNRVDLDQLASKKPDALNLQCYQNMIYIYIKIKHTKYHVLVFILQMP